MQEFLIETKYSIEKINEEAYLDPKILLTINRGDTCLLRIKNTNELKINIR